MPCEACHGYRLKPEALCVKIGGRHIGEVSDLSVKAAAQWFAELPQKLNAKQNEIAGRILKEIRARLKFLVDVGLDYLTLARATGTLSGGESQRIRLASQIGSGLTGVLYVLDEPSIGLHQRDNERLLETLKRLRDLGNTVIVVEHDEDAIRAADYVVDVGPGAGVHGGRIVAEGTPADIMANPNSLTGQYLNGVREIAGAGAAAEEPEPRAETHRRPRQQPEERHRRNSARAVHLRHRRVRRRQVDAADRHALQGAGAAAQRRQRSPGPLRPHRRHRAPRQGHRHRPVADRPHAALQPGHLYRRVHADPRMVRRPAREQGARLRARPLLVQRQGRALRGLPGRRRDQDRDALSARRLCHLRRLQGQALQPRDAGGPVQGQVHRRRARHDGRGGAGILQGGAAGARRADALRRVGLDYIHVGQQATTLSGGEAQRVKLAKELSKRATGRTLYILDEPTTGLHFHDVAKFLEVLHELVESGNTVVVIEHNLEVIKTADWIIDLGPEGGDGGGEIVAAGTPEDVVREKRSYTGAFLKPVLARGSGAQARRNASRRRSSTRTAPANLAWGEIDLPQIHCRGTVSPYLGSQFQFKPAPTAI